jgi:hypothetical protein
MRTRTICRCIAAAMLLLPFLASGNLAFGQITASDLTKALKPLGDQVRSLRAEMVKKEDLSGLVTKKDFDAKMKEIDGKIEAVDEAYQSLSRKVGEISRDYPDGRSYPSILGNMNNESFRDEVKDAVHDVMERTGSLTVDNDTDVAQYLLVNGREERIPAGGERTISVPTGTLTTELHPYESPKTWTIAAPNYSQTIRIHRGAQRRVTRYADSEPERVVTRYYDEPERVVTRYYDYVPEVRYTRYFDWWTGYPVNIVLD